MKNTRRVRRAWIVVGALAIAGAPTAIAEPAPSTAAETTTAAPTTSANMPPVAEMPSDCGGGSGASTTSPCVTTSARPTTPTSTRPVRTPAVPASTTASPTPSSATTTVPTTLAGPGELRVDTGQFVVTGPVQAGALVPGTMDVTVTDTRRDGAGWTTDVRATAMHGTHGNVFSPGPDSFYRAQNTQCSESTGRVPLREDAVIVATAPAACSAATWTAAVGIAVPADVAADTYSLTITHSVY